MLILKDAIVGDKITNIYIKDNKIFNISPKFVASKKDEVINLNKKCVLPGLIDTHLHTFFSSKDTSNC
jgi:imidazolonepropionase-like amidohydrolase